MEVQQLPQSLYDKLNPVAKRVGEACSVIFGPAKYSVKIYLQTKHKVTIANEESEVEMLTSLVKYPYFEKGTSGGRSWINSRKNKATVWECILNSGKEGIICKKNEPTGKSKEVYPSIAYFKLPEGIGVLTIVSSEESTFCNSKNIGEDVKTTLMIATNTLTREALS